MTQAIAPTASAGADKRPARVAAPPPSTRLQITSRVLAAIFAGYLLAALVQMLMARTLPMARTEATSLATLLCFTTYTCAVMWAFAARTVRQAWLGLLAPAAAAWAILLVMGAPR